MIALLRLAPAVVLGLGGLALVKVGAQHRMELRGPLESIPRSISGAAAVDNTVPEEERRIAGMDAYVLRTYVRPDSTLAFSVYVGYYMSQTDGKSIHSPKNCLPGAGWEPVESRPLTIRVPGGNLTVNRYLLEKGNARSVAYYWYQGRGRTSWNEYLVKWELFRDKARHSRSDEALVRIVVPLINQVDTADAVLRAVATALVPTLTDLLPGPPRAQAPEPRSGP
jgi:EpsI family protein